MGCCAEISGNQALRREISLSRSSLPSTDPVCAKPTQLPNGKGRWCVGSLPAAHVGERFGRCPSCCIQPHLPFPDLAPPELTATVIFPRILSGMGPWMRFLSFSAHVPISSMAMKTSVCVGGRPRPGYHGVRRVLGFPDNFAERRWWLWVTSHHTGGGRQKSNPGPLYKHKPQLPELEEPALTAQGCSQGVQPQGGDGELQRDRRGLLHW